MFYKFRRMIMKGFHVKNSFYRVLAYCIAAFLMLQCYGMSRASEEDEYLAEIATIGDATWTSAPEQTGQTETGGLCLDELVEETQKIENAISDTYRVTPDTGNAFVAYAMSIERGAGMNVNNQCAIYVASVLSNYYEEKAPVKNMTLVSQISNTLNASEYWECVYASADCFPAEKTESEYDSIFDNLTNAGDIVCFVNGSLDNYVHCSIAGGGNALIGHLYSSGWDCLRACYYIDNAVDTRKACSGMIVYRYKEPVRRGTIRVCKNYDETVYRTNPTEYDIGGANYAVYLSRLDAENGTNAKGFCYIEPGENGGLAGDNVSYVATTKPNGEGEIVWFDPGTIYIKEYSAPVGAGWKLDTNIYETQIMAGRRTTLGQPRDKYANPMDLTTADYYDTTVLGPEVPEFGQLGLQKRVTEYYAAWIAGNKNYDYSGIEYAVYRVNGDEELNVSDLVGTFKMDAEGTGYVSMCGMNESCVGTTTMLLPFGWYMIQEITTNASMALNTTPRWVQMIKGKKEVQIESVYDNPKFAKASLLLRKFGESGEAVSGATYTISYYKETMTTNPALEGIAPEKVWVFQTDAQGEIRYSDDLTWFVEGDDFYRDPDNQIIIPAGTLTFQEKEAPIGYKLDETVYVKTIVPEEEQFLSVENAVMVVEEKILKPEIRTKAWYDKTIIDFEKDEQTITVTDTIFCKNLQPGHVYRIAGEPHHKQDGSVFLYNGEPVKGYTEFTADKVEMQVDVSFEIVVTKELYGRQLVFFESLTDMAHPEEIMAEHKDLEDENQTIDIPKPELPPITTLATPTEPEATPTEPEEITTEQSVILPPAVKGQSEVRQVETTVKTGDDSRVFVAILVASTTAIGTGALLFKKRQVRKR